jgi:hypothetical protein
LQEDDHAVCIWVALDADEDAHAGVKLLQRIAKVSLKIFIDDYARRDVPESGELLLKLGGKFGRVDGSKTELRPRREGEAVVDGVVGWDLIEVG